MSNIISYKAVVFDLYDTLITITNKTNPYSRLLANIGLRTSEEFKQARAIALTEDFNDLAGFVQRIKPDATIHLQPYEKEVETEIASTRLYSETTLALTELKQREIKLGLISNLASPYKKSFFELGLGRYFDEVIFSCEAGLKKPDTRIYQKMVELLRVEPHQAIMVGNSLQNDFNGPRAIGMPAILLDRFDSLETIPKIDSLEGILRF